MRSVRVALAQINSTVGDIKGNSRKILEHIRKAANKGAEVIAFPELTLTGYPPEDLLLKPGFIEDNLLYLNKLIPHSKDITIIVGFVDKQDDIFNAAAVLNNQRLAGIYHKHFLPNYGVFDEDRYFQNGKETPVYVLNNINIGINICEDIWYPYGAPRDQALYGNAEILINLSASPFSIGKTRQRIQMLKQRALDNTVIVAYVGTVGGQDELIFDGNSVIISEDGDLIAKSPAFQEHLLLADLHPDNVFTQRLHDPRRRKEKLFIPKEKVVQLVQLGKTRANKKKPFIKPEIVKIQDSNEEIYEALKLGLKDYVKKNHFEKVVLGLSGGIDSALVAAIAVDALGSKNAIGIIMPSEFTTRQSTRDAHQLARNLKIKIHEIWIDKILNVYQKELNPIFKKEPEDITEENLQARIRGNLLMALSNKFGWLVLATGNKSEVSVGYCTLYGDMVGGFSVIKDVGKQLVYELCKFRNEFGKKEIFPNSILTKEPSAELRHNQKDSDSIPPYEVLDPILRAYVEEDRSFEEIVSQGFKPADVKKTIQLVDGNEYKRRQGAPGIKITLRAFGKDRRFPITNRYKDH
jgi:NAD+ synthase (glutamine-hydrolysing)